MSANYAALAQGSPEWKQARSGSVGASDIADVCAKLKSGGYGASRAQLMARLLCERLTGTPTDSFVSAAMQNGIDTEPMARAAYEAHSGSIVETIGLIKHPTLLYSHASPDGVIGVDGLCEIKCPQPAKHLETLLSEVIDSGYHKQMQWQLACSGRKWCDFVSFSPAFPETLQLFFKRVARDDGVIAELEREVALFLAECTVKYQALTTKYDIQVAA